MADIEFLCPHCGQQIACDATGAGSQVACPTCGKQITVPASGSSGPPPLPAKTKLAVAPTKPPESPAAKPSPPPAPVKPLGLAKASLVLSLASLVIGPLGYIPGIICGHMAKARIKRDSTLGGQSTANAGLAIGYIFLTLSLIGVLLVFFVFAEALNLAKSETEKATTNMVTAADNKAASKTPKSSKSGKTSSSSNTSKSETEVAQATRAFLDALKRRDDEAIKKLLSEKARPNYKPSVMQQDPDATFEVGRVTLRSDNTARVQVKGMSQGMEIPSQVRLRRESNEWRVYALSLFAEEGKPGIMMDFEKGLDQTMALQGKPPPAPPTPKSKSKGKAAQPAMEISLPAETSPNELAMGALTWIFGSRKKDGAGAAEKPPADAEAEAEKNTPLNFEGKSPARLDFIAVDGAANARKVKVRLTNHANKAIRKVQIMMYCLDDGASLLKESACTLINPNPYLVAKQAAKEMELPVVVPADTKSVNLEVQEVQFRDGSEWKSAAAKTR